MDHSGPSLFRLPCAVPLSRCPAVPLSRCPAVPLSRCPAVPLSRCPAVPLFLLLLLPLDHLERLHPPVRTALRVLHLDLEGVIPRLELVELEGAVGAGDREGGALLEFQADLGAAAAEDLAEQAAAAALL